MLTLRRPVGLATGLLLLSVLAACDKGGDKAGAPGATAASGAATASAKAPVAAPASAAPAASAPAAKAPPVKLTPAAVVAYKPKSYSFDNADAAISTITADLGAPTFTSPERVGWGAVDDKECASVTVRRAGSVFLAFESQPKPVEKKFFGEQWGKLCLQFAGKEK